MMGEATVNQRWAATLVGALVGQGVRHAVIAPGSRSTPLALAFADRADVRCWSVIDERSAGFFALGLARAAGMPAAAVCTSGTAGAHFLPAVMEASEACVPLVVLTADRPWELHGFGAPQAVSQVGLFGSFVRGAQALPVPEVLGLEHLAAVTARLAHLAQQAPRGPVHLNVPFREPLASPDGTPGPTLDPHVAGFATASPRFEFDAEVLAAVAGAKRGLIVCGPRDRDDGFGAWVHALGERVGFPVLAEAASNARFGYERAIGLYDGLLRDEAFARQMRPDVVLRFGGPLTSKGPQAWLDGADARVFAFHDDGLALDPAHRASRYSYLGPPWPTLPPKRNGQAELWLAAQRRAQQSLGERQALCEPLVARGFIAGLPEGTQVVLSSSMPIRDVDTFGMSTRRLRVFSNRGVNGIDGVTSTALGIAALTQKPTALLIGDVALLHDLSAWVLARRLGVPMTVVVVNNDGGGIFHFLPIAKRSAHFEDFFATPHGVDLAQVAALAGAQFHRSGSVRELTQTVARSLEAGLHLIEVRTDRHVNVDVHRELLAGFKGVNP
jgi:2-succinyl-5-enolpyruvyl-6-hydroxy-3-cyclohexene-1-carboxylate synthase